MEQYQSHLEEILERGAFNPDRTGKGRLRLPGIRTRSYDLTEGFPITTTKHVPFKMITRELFWFLTGDTKLSTLLDRNISIWTPDAMNTYRESPDADLDMTVSEFEHEIKTDEEFRERWNDLGPIYGYQFRRLPNLNEPQTIGQHRSFPPIDQIKRNVELLEKNPLTSKNLTSAWNPLFLGQMALEPCHSFFHVLDYGDGVELTMYQRSADMMLGVPFNITSYALLTHLIAAAAGRPAQAFHHVFGDDHLYGDHLPKALEQLSRTSKKLPRLVMDDDIGEWFKEVLDGGVENPIDEATQKIRLENYVREKWIWAPLHVGLPDHLMKDTDKRVSYEQELRETHPGYLSALADPATQVVPFNGRGIPVKYIEAA